MKSIFGAVAAACIVFLGSCSATDDTVRNEALSQAAVAEKFADGFAAVAPSWDGEPTKDQMTRYLQQNAAAWRALAEVGADSRPTK